MSRPTGPRSSRLRTAAHQLEHITGVPGSSEAGGPLRPALHVQRHALARQQAGLPAAPALATRARDCQKAGLKYTRYTATTTSTLVTRRSTLVNPGRRKAIPAIAESASQQTILGTIHSCSVKL